MHLCTKKGCKQRLSFGIEGQNGSIPYACTNCPKLYHNNSLNVIIIALIFFLLAGISYYKLVYETSVTVPNKGPVIETKEKLTPISDEYSERVSAFRDINGTYERIGQAYTLMIDSSHTIESNTIFSYVYRGQGTDEWKIGHCISDTIILKKMNGEEVKYLLRREEETDNISIGSLINPNLTFFRKL